MITVAYRYQFNYRYIGDERWPLLQVGVYNPGDPERGLDVDAYIDSGAGRSIFDGFIISALGLELANGERKQFSPTAGPSVTAYLHRVRLVHPDLGSFDLEIGFSDIRIRRNLLGRDFFNLAQIGFRERQLEYYITPSP